MWLFLCPLLSQFGDIGSEPFWFPTPFSRCRTKVLCASEGSLLRGNLFLLPDDHCFLAYGSFVTNMASCQSTHLTKKIQRESLNLFYSFSNFQHLNLVCSKQQSCFWLLYYLETFQSNMQNFLCESFISPLILYSNATCLQREHNNGQKQT